MAYSDQSRDVEHSDRLRDEMRGAPNPYNAGQEAPSGRSIAILFGALIAIFLVIALFSWTSGGPGTTTQDTQSPAVEQSAPAPEPTAPAQ